MNPLQMLIYGFCFGLGFTMAYGVLNMTSQLVSHWIIKSMVKKYKKSNKPEDLHFGGLGKGDKII